MLIAFHTKELENVSSRYILMGDNINEWSYSYSHSSFIKSPGFPASCAVLIPRRPTLICFLRTIHISHGLLSFLKGLWNMTLREVQQIGMLLLDLWWGTAVYQMMWRGCLHAWSWWWVSRRAYVWPALTRFLMFEKKSAKPSFSLSRVTISIYPL